MIQTCRICRNPSLIEILDLGFAPPSNNLLDSQDMESPEVYFPLKLLFCENCKLGQTMDFHNNQELFNSKYPYLSSTSTTWINHSLALAQKLINNFNLTKDSLVVEVASNDGYLLQYFNQQGIPNYGIEPTKIPFEIAIKKGLRVHNIFLTEQTSNLLLEKHGTVDLIIAINVFAHVRNLDDFCKAIKNLLKPSGTLVVEVQYLPTLLIDQLFDTIYHEHFSYFTFFAIETLLKIYDLQIYKVEKLETHGGSIRIFAQKIPTTIEIHTSVPDIKTYENSLNLSQLLKEFGIKVQIKRDEIKNFISELRKQNKKIAFIGAAAKGNTLINYCGLSKNDVCAVFDSAESKHNKYLPGSHIPIKPFLKENLSQFDSFIILPWNLSNEFSQLIIKMGFQNSYLIFRLLPEIQRLN